MAKHADMHLADGESYPWLILTDENHPRRAQADLARKISKALSTRNFHEWVALEAQKQEPILNTLSQISAHWETNPIKDFDTHGFYTAFSLAHRRLITNSVIIIPDHFKTNNIGSYKYNLRTGNPVPGIYPTAEIYSDFYIPHLRCHFEINQITYTSQFGWYEYKIPISCKPEFYSIFVPVFAIEPQVLKEVLEHPQGIFSLFAGKQAIDSPNHDVLHNFLHVSASFSPRTAVRSSFLIPNSPAITPEVSSGLYYASNRHPHLEDFAVQLFSYIANSLPAIRNKTESSLLWLSELKRTAGEIPHIDFLEHVSAHHSRKLDVDLAEKTQRMTNITSAYYKAFLGALPELNSRPAFRREVNLFDEALQNQPENADWRTRIEQGRVFEEIHRFSANRILG